MDSPYNYFGVSFWCVLFYLFGYEMKKRFFYWGNGYWRSYDSLGRISNFYTLRQIGLFHDKQSKRARATREKILKGMG